MKTCSTCRYWDDSDDYLRTSIIPNLGECRYVKMYWDCTEWNADGDRRLKPECVTQTAFVQDGSDYSASLYTVGGHGCIAHEERACGGVR